MLLLSPSNSNLRLTQCLETSELPVPVRDFLSSAIEATYSVLGAFGATNGNSSTPAFVVKPASGFGVFNGGTGAFGGATTFGQAVNNQASTSTTSVFGQSANSNANNSAFGPFNKTFGGELSRVLSRVVRLSTLFKVQR